MNDIVHDPHAAAAQVREWLADSDRILIGAGAGLSAAAGYDYGDKTRFAELFPAMVRRGFSARYELIGRPLPAAIKWGYWFTHVNDIRYAPEPNPVYQNLRHIVGERDHFVMTSNVDALFARNGFDGNRVYTPQGDYGFMQCSNACTRETWSTEPEMRRALEHYDPETGALSRDDAIPVCPTCGGEVFLNVRLDAHFIFDAYAETGRELQEWVGSGHESRLLVIDIGSGFNTPGVIRWPMEQITHAFPGARLVRVNPTHPETHEAIAARSLQYAGDAAQLLEIVTGA